MDIEEENNLYEAFVNTFDDDAVQLDKEKTTDPIPSEDDVDEEDEDNAWGDKTNPEDEIPDIPFKDDE